jgi:hypothetical protein
MHAGMTVNDLDDALRAKCTLECGLWPAEPGPMPGGAGSTARSNVRVQSALSEDVAAPVQQQLSADQAQAEWEALQLPGDAAA